MNQFLPIINKYNLSIPTKSLDKLRPSNFHNNILYCMVRSYKVTSEYVYRQALLHILNFTISILFPKNEAKHVAQ